MHTLQFDCHFRNAKSLCGGVFSFATILKFSSSPPPPTAPQQVSYCNEQQFSCHLADRESLSVQHGSKSTILSHMNTARFSSFLVSLNLINRNCVWKLGTSLYYVIKENSPCSTVSSPTKVRQKGRTAVTAPLNLTANLPLLYLQNPALAMLKKSACSHWMGL